MNLNLQYTEYRYTYLKIGDEGTPHTYIYIEVLPFWIPPTPREIRLKKLNVSPTLYCNVLPLTVYFIGKLMY